MLRPDLLKDNLRRPKQPLPSIFANSLSQSLEFFLAVHVSAEACKEGKPASQAGALAKCKFVILSSSLRLFSPWPVFANYAVAFAGMELK